MSDKELLEFAAKAAGIALIWGNLCPEIPLNAETSFRWNPLKDDGDALRLAVKLGLPVLTHGEQVPFDYAKCYSAKEPHGNDPYAATRRAIVRAAAAIGDKP